MKLLLVEDDNGIGQFIVRGLKGAGHVVDWVVHGRSAASRASQTNYDAVILDLMLPDMAGIDVCAELRRQERPTPILILSACDQIDQKVSGLDAGADDYITKPFEFNELLARLRALQRRTQSESRKNNLNAGILVLDRDAHNVWLGKQSIDLTPREFRLLEHLLENKNRAVTRNSILAKVWGVDADVNDNTVDVYIGYLRKKLNLAEQLVTVRGVGFKLQDKQYVTH
ncbi:response regulator transcription factor [Rhodoblastus sp.]|uniref:response regulator transcription factor n=1 Tax=Rhodoblastus sp. TaxID=1962975 RepID=UPI003F9685D1